MSHIGTLSPDEVRRMLAIRASRVNDFLRGQPEIWRDAPDRLREAMLYSLSAGGKRLRPVLCIACAAACGCGEERVMPFACAIELIHTYSLIHDDLPAMDNDDFRRGRPSSHRRFDEATAILAGDGLLTDAFALALSAPAEPEALLRAVRELALAAGSTGMAGGQMLDMQYTGNRNVGIGDVAHMQELKTGRMIRMSCLCGALLASAGQELADAFASYGASLGRAFQIADDILDITGNPGEMGKPAGSDEASGKNTFPFLVGLDASRQLARDAAASAVAALPDSPETPFLAGLAEYVVSRSV